MLRNEKQKLHTNLFEFHKIFPIYILESRCLFECPFSFTVLIDDEVTSSLKEVCLCVQNPKKILMQKKKSLTNTVSYTHTQHVIIFTAIPWMDSGLKYEKIQYTKN